MPTRALLYLVAVIGTGGLILCAAAAQWSAGFDPSFLLTLTLGILVSSVKIQLPGFTGTVSGGFAFVLLTAALFDWQSTVTMAALAALTQSIWLARRRPKWYQVAFNVANLVVCSTLAHVAPAVMASGHASLRLAMAGLLLFLTNTLSVSLMVCLADRRPLASAWDQCRLWTAPYYLAGGMFLGALTGAGPQAGSFPASVFLATALIVITSSYRTLLSFLGARITS